jgi:hypothetical protein
MRRILAATLGGLVLLAGGLSTAGEKGKTVMPFNGNNLDGWKLRNPAKNSWDVGTASVDEKAPSKFEFKKEGHELVNVKGGGTDIYTDDKFGDVLVEVEFMVPKGSNSGVYLMGNYEVQILDSYGKKTLSPGDLGGLYGASAPKVNAARKPGEWQKFIIDFQAPRFDGDKKVQNAKFLKVELNGELIQENVEMKGATGGALGKEAPTGPLMFQGDHGAVAFRNIKIVAK